jgi:phosphatidylglycerophosphate synthase
VRRVQGPVRDSVPTAPLAGFVGLIGLLAVLAGTTGLGAPGWVVGATCGAGLAVLLTRAMARHGRVGLGPADRVTLVRAVLVCGVAALTADSFGTDPAPGILVALSIVALMLDGVDGQVARRTGTVSAFGARFDFEVDAFLILVLSACVAGQWGWWVLVLGLARYLFVAAGWALPWLRGTPPPRRWSKVVAVIVAVVLVVAAAGILADAATVAILIVAIGLLAESFGRSIWELWRLDGGHQFPWPAVTAALALLLVWTALLVPDRLDDVAPGAFLRIPIEGLLLVAIALALPPGGARVLALLGGLILGVLTILRLLDMGFQVAFDTPFHPVYDAAYAGAAWGLLSDSIGGLGALVALIGAGLLVIGLLFLLPISTLRVTRLAAAHRRPSIRVLALLTSTAVVAAVLGTQFGPAGSVPSTAAAQLAVTHVDRVRDDLGDQREFERALEKQDPFHSTSGEDLLTQLRGKDVLLVFIESYGPAALAAPVVGSALDAGQRRLQQAGFSARSGWLTSPTFGGLSWLAHSTLQSGLWVDNQQRYNHLVTSDRLTLTGAFGRAGWRTVAVAPAIQGAWPEASTFYHYDQVYDRRNLGYVGPEFSWAAMPDQYTLAALQRMELDRAARGPIMAEVNLVSSHWPWAPLPRMVDWDLVGDGSIFDPMPAEGRSPDEVGRDPDLIRAAYADSIAYSLDAVTSFVQQVNDPDLVLVVLGDHQPSSLVSGQGASHDVPVSIIAGDPAVTDRAAGWGWRAGLRPDSDSPVWPMDSFRDRFLAGYGQAPTTPAAPRS